jgi:LysR family hydrogen peroxide-inducible transcriptional activator
MPKLRQLEYLVALADTRHFGLAADSAHISQPTLSQQIRALEATLGTILVERNESPVQLTPIGREIAARARLVLLGVDDIRALARRANNEMVGTIRLGVSPTLGPYLLPGIIASLHRAFPDLRLFIRDGIPDRQALELGRGELDMMLGPLPISGGGLHVEPLFRENLHIVASPDDKLAGGQLLNKRDLAGCNFLSLDGRHHFGRQTRAICEELNAVLLPDYEGTSLDSLRQMAGSGLGLALLPELYLRSEVGGEDMVTRLNIADWSATRSIAAIWRTGVAYRETYRQIAEAIAAEARRILQGELR